MKFFSVKDINAMFIHRCVQEWLNSFPLVHVSKEAAESDNREPARSAII